MMYMHVHMPYPQIVRAVTMSATGAQLPMFNDLDHIRNFSMSEQATQSLVKQTDTTLREHMVKALCK